MNFQSLLLIQSRSLNAQERRQRLASLSFLSSPIFATYGLGHTAITSPIFCPIFKLTGIPCPGCGMTRSFMAIAQGEIQEAITFHLFGPLVFTIFIGLIVHLCLELYTRQSIRFPVLNQLFYRLYLPLFAFISLFTYHAWRLRILAQSGELAISMTAAPLHQLFSSF